MPLVNKKERFEGNSYIIIIIKIYIKQNKKPKQDNFSRTASTVHRTPPTPDIPLRSLPPRGLSLSQVSGYQDHLRRPKETSNGWAGWGGEGRTPVERAWGGVGKRGANLTKGPGACPFPEAGGGRLILGSLARWVLSSRSRVASPPGLPSLLLSLAPCLPLRAV